MRKVVTKAKSVSSKSVHVLRSEGLTGFARRSASYAYYRQFPDRKRTYYRDILFINGCALPHPARYRVDHQIEQLNAYGMTADQVFYDQLSLEKLKYYRGFVFFRVPITNVVKEFITQARTFNKICFFDIDDLVIDQKFTDQIGYVKNMSAPDKALYNDGVKRMRETLSMCDYAITTTGCLQRELNAYTSEVFINRNVASDEMVAKSLSALEDVRHDSTKIVIGYFSGSITHNEDFELVMPALVELLNKHSNLYIKVAGLLDIPEALRPFKDRLLRVEFMDWRTMPKEIAACDINIAPLTSNVFNEAKSENKWTEASLVQVVTAASDIGAFKEVIKHGETGILVKDADWFQALDGLISDRQQRERIAQAARRAVIERHTTIATGKNIVDILQAKLARNVAFALPSTEISGGVNVVLKHAEILRHKGWDVTLIDTLDKNTIKKLQKQYEYRHDIPGYNVISRHRAKIDAHFDTMVATFWSTLEYVKKQQNTKNVIYFVQSLETDFYKPGLTDPRVHANATYCDDTKVQYATMSLWCKKWLRQRFNKDAKYCSNGINLDYYTFRKRNFDKSKIKILIEGDSSSEYKNTDEAFRIVEKLDPNRYDISYLSYHKEPKSWYRVDHFYNRIAPEKVGEVYAGCDILLKTSILESFSYPPLEMMATGGIAVVVPNDGNREYLRDRENCLFYEQGNIDDGVNKIAQILKDNELREKLIKNGLETAQRYSWENLEEEVSRIYA